jgi:hypothetical protein
MNDLTQLTDETKTVGPLNQTSGTMVTAWIGQLRSFLLITCVAACSVLFMLVSSLTSYLPLQAISHQTNGGKNRFGTSHLAYLPLLPWEVESMGANRTCNAPDGFPDYCCIGSGHADTYEPVACNLTLPVYERNERMALDSLPPLPSRIQSRDMECDWCRIIDILLENNLTMAFHGDSLTQQSFVNVECELRRRGMYHVEVKVIPISDDWWRLRFIRELHVSKLSDHSADGNVAVAKLRLYKAFFPDLSNVTEFIVSDNNVIVFDYGLHYDPNENGFTEAMTSLLHVLLPVAERGDLKMLAWRETSAQHFDKPGGHYYSEFDKVGCFPLEYTVGVGDERRRDMEKIVESMSLTDAQLTLLPFREYTSQFHELHPTQGRDCTHYCTTPSFALYESRQVRIAMEDALLRWQTQSKISP